LQARRIVKFTCHDGQAAKPDDWEADEPTTPTHLAVLPQDETKLMSFNVVQYLKPIRRLLDDVSHDARTKTYRRLDSSVKVVNVQVEMDTILDCFALGDLLEAEFDESIDRIQAQPCWACRAQVDCAAHNSLPETSHCFSVRTIENHSERASKWLHIPILDAQASKISWTPSHCHS
jgi:hypothetical protein